LYFNSFALNNSNVFTFTIVVKNTIWFYLCVLLNITFESLCAKMHHCWKKLWNTKKTPCKLHINCFLNPKKIPKIPIYSFIYIKKKEKHSLKKLDKLKYQNWDICLKNIIKKWKNLKLKKMKNTFLKRRKPGKKIKVTRKSERNSHKWNGKIWITARKKKLEKMWRVSEENKWNSHKWKWERSVKWKSPLI
jgi:hypothetical protein